MTDSTHGSGINATCEACGAPATIHISDMKDGVATIQHMCAACVDTTEHNRDSRRRCRGNAALIIVVGAMITLISVLADWLRFGSGEGFGSQQRQGVFIGAVLLMFGAVVRARTLFVAAAAAAILSLLADWLAFGSNAGFGRQQIIGCSLGISLITIGIWWSRRYG